MDAFLRRLAFFRRVAFLRVAFFRVTLLRAAFLRLTVLRVVLRADFLLGLGGRLIPIHCRRLKWAARLILLWGRCLNFVSDH